MIIVERKANVADQTCDSCGMDLHVMSPGDEGPSYKWEHVTITHERKARVGDSIHTDVIDLCDACALPAGVQLVQLTSAGIDFPEAP